MRIRAKMCVFTLAIFALFPYGVLAQDAGSTDKPLGDVARKVRSEKSKEAKPVKTITNDNLTTAQTEKSLTTSATADKEKKTEKAEGTGAEAKEKKGEPAAAEAEEAHNEQYYRKHLSDLNATLEIHKRELEVLQQKLNLNQTVYYNDPQKTMEQEYSRGDIAKLTQQLDAKKQQIADDEKAIEDLHEQLRHEGGDPGWLR